MMPLASFPQMSRWKLAPGSWPAGWNGAALKLLFICIVPKPLPHKLFSCTRVSARRALWLACTALPPGADEWREVNGENLALQGTPHHPLV